MLLPYVQWQVEYIVVVTNLIIIPNPYLLKCALLDIIHILFDRVFCEKNT